jgi:hypothetical protein
MHAVTHSLLARGHLRPDANGFGSVLEEPEAIEELVNHVWQRIEDSEIGARHATALIGRLPVILERSGIAPNHSGRRSKRSRNSSSMLTRLACRSWRCGSAGS